MLVSIPYNVLSKLFVGFSTGYNVIACSLFILVLSGCKDETNIKYINRTPAYLNIKVNFTGDSIQFKANAKSNPDMRSFNYFVEHNKEYFSLFDKRNHIVNIYEFKTGNLVNTISLDSQISKKGLSKKASVYVKSLDSILVISFLDSYMLNSSGKIIDSLPLQRDPYPAFTSVENYTLPAFVGDNIYLKSSPYLQRQKESDLKKWKILYEINFNKHKTELRFPLPKNYIQNNYSREYFNFSYCLNDEGKFVFSYPGDSLIYVTDQDGNGNSYYAKSKWHKSLDYVTNDKASSENKALSFLRKDAYGPIYYDNYRKQYLRIAQKGISEDDFLHRIWSKRQAIIILDKELRVIGESEVDRNINLYTLFFTKDGDMYAQKRSDKGSISFVKLDYTGLKDSKVAKY